MESAASPILVLGAARSGTHLLASTIAKNLDAAYIGETNELWKRFVPVTKSDYIPSSYATEDVVSRLREAFAEAARKRGGKILLEKTPANTLRLGFVTRVFPEAALVHIIRDGRDVAVSAAKKYEGDNRKVTRHGGQRPAIKKRLYKFARIVAQKRRTGLRPTSVLRDFRRYWNGMLSMLGMKQRVMWGPRFPGYKTYYETCSPLEVAAVQWKLSVESALNVIASKPNLRVHEVKYEDLVARPQKTLAGVFAFLATDATPAPSEINHDIGTGGRGWEDVLSKEEKKVISEHIEHTLRTLGYKGTW